MKTFFTKIFLASAAILCTLEGLVLVDIGLKRVAPDRFLALYVQLFNVPNALKTVLGMGLFFILLAFALVLVTFRVKQPLKLIEVEKDGKVLRIPQETIVNFIKQIIEQNPYMNDITVDLEPDTKSPMTIRIVSGFKDVPTIHDELGRVEETLRGEIFRVFQWQDFAFRFQLREVSIDPQRKYFTYGNNASGDAAAGSAPGAVMTEGDALLSEIVKEPSEDLEEPAEEAEDKPKRKNMFATIFGGKNGK